MCRGGLGSPLILSKGNSNEGNYSSRRLWYAFVSPDHRNI